MLCGWLDAAWLPFHKLPAPPVTTFLSLQTDKSSVLAAEMVSLHRENHSPETWL